MFERIVEASAYLKDKVELTPVLHAPGLTGAKNTYLKAENLQTTGSFKIRGAYYRMSKLTEEEKNRGVIACSAGNHAQGVALAARDLGIECVICMPETAPISKVQRTEAYGATVILVPGVVDDTFVYAQKLAAEKGYTFIHPFNDLDVIAGQGTIGLEIMEQVPNADIVLVAIGGGGILAGISSAIHKINPKCQVIGVEPLGAASMKQSIDHNRICTLKQVQTIADGVAVKTPGVETFPLCQRHVHDFVTVTENQITMAMFRLLEDHKILVEGAGAAPVAAAMYGKVDVRGKNIVCVLSGGNVDINVVERIIAKGLRYTGRILSFATTLTDKPNELHLLSKILGECGANVLSVHHDREDLDISINECVIHITLEARGPEHLQEVLTALEEHGYDITEE